jgi:hypothetical protein
MKEDGSIKREEVKIFPARAFLFNPDKFEFNLANSKASKTVKLADIEDINDIDRFTYELKEEIDSNDQRKALLMSTVCDLIELPTLRKWLISLNESENKLLCKKVESVIKDTFYKLAVVGGKPIARSVRAKPGSIYSFRAKIHSNGTFRLTTLGEYSALGTGEYLPNGSITYGHGVSQRTAWEDPSLPIEYQLHNADRDNGEAKRISLYAGAGTIAWLAANSQKS